MPYFEFRSAGTLTDATPVVAGVNFLTLEQLSLIPNTSLILAQQQSEVVTRDLFSGIHCGLPVVGGGANRVLFEDASGNLATVAGFTFDGTTLVAPNFSGTVAGYQPLDGTLSALAAQNWVANAIPIGTGADTVGQTSFAASTFPARASSGNLVAKTITDFGLSLVDDADATTARTTLGVVIGTNVQAWDADLDAIAAISGTSGLLKKTAANTWSLDTSTYATQAYADALVVGLLDDRGNYNASGNVFPSSGGSGSAGAVLKGDLWTISVAGTLGGHAVTAGDVVRALVDSPGQTDGNWAIGENNFGYVALNQALADGKIYIGNGSGIGSAVTPSGDVTITNAGVTAIGASKVTNAMLAGSIVYGKLILTGAILNADLAGSIAASKLIGTDIATVGTVVTGTWHADVIGPQYGGTGLNAIAQGDMLFGSATNAISVLAKNTSATRYMSNTGTSNNPAWAQIDLSNGVTGDLPFANLTQIAALSVLGVTGASTADVAGIAGTANQALRVNSGGTALTFGSINLASSAAVTGVLPLANGGTNNASWTAGSIPYVSGSNSLTENNSNLFWDNGSFYLGLGTTSPARRLEISDSGSNFQLKIGKGGNNAYDIGRSDSDGLLYFYGKQTGFTGHVFTGIDGEWARLTSVGLTAINYVSTRKFLTNYPNLATALSSIGSSTQTELVVTSQYSETADRTIPANIQVTFEGAGSFTVASTKTLTILSLTPPPSCRVFFGAGNVVLGKNASPYIDIAWWAGIAGSGSDDNHAFDQATTSLTNNGGGVLQIGLGIWKVFNFSPPSGSIIRGAGMGIDGTHATVLILSDLSTAGAVVKINQSAFYGVVIENLTISASTSTTSSCLIAAGASSNTGTMLSCSDVTFHGTGTSAPAQVKVTVTSGSWELNAGIFHHCAWWVPTNSIAVGCDTDNTSLQITNSFIYMADGASGIKASHIGSLKIDSTTFNGGGNSAAATVSGAYRTYASSSLSGTTLTTDPGDTALTISENGCRVVIGAVDTYIARVTGAHTATLGASGTASGTATVYRPVPSTTRGKAAVWFTGSHGNIEINNCRDESLQYFLITDGGAGGQPYYPVKITNGSIQSFIQMNTDITLYLDANDLFSNVLQDASGVNSKIFATGNRINKGSLAPGNDPRGGSAWNLSIPQLWGYHDGVSMIQTEFSSVQPTSAWAGQLQFMRMPTTIVHGTEYAANPENTRPVFGIASASTSGNTKPGLRVGRWDIAADDFDFWFDQYRDGSDGYYAFNGNQTGFIAYKFNGAILPGSRADSDGDAANNSIYYSTTAAKLVFKDGSGVVHNLY